MQTVRPVHPLCDIGIAACERAGSDAVAGAAAKPAKAQRHAAINICTRFILILTNLF
jgi:hypothetical protein